MLCAHPYLQLSAHVQRVKWSARGVCTTPCGSYGHWVIVQFRRQYENSGALSPDDASALATSKEEKRMEDTRIRRRSRPHSRRGTCLDCSEIADPCEYMTNPDHDGALLHCLLNIVTS